MLLKIVFLNTVMKTFVKDISNIDIKKRAVQGLISAIRFFLALYIIVDEAQYIKTEI